jgi:hypothetical protein
MNRGEAELFLVAARDNPFVAAWISVLDEYKAPPNCQIAPQDWWDAYQEFFNLGLILETDFRSIDVTRTFFGKMWPTNLQIQDALCQLRTLRAMHETKETQRSDTKFSLFENEDRALVQSTGANTQLGNVIGAQVRGISPFEERGGAIGPVLDQSPIEAPMMVPPRPRSMEFKPFEPAMKRGVGPACKAEVDVDATPRPDGLELEVRCCGHAIDYIQDDGECLEPEDSPDGQAAMEFIFHGKCEHCGSIVHFSVAKPVPNDTFRR